MHSGYFYKLTRLKKSPPLNYLRSLIIFKWQSYLTFVTGILLLFVIYYYNSGILMVNKKVLEINPSHLESILSLYFYWIVYDFLCKSFLGKFCSFYIYFFFFIVVNSFGLTKIFSPKFAFLSVGLILGTNMFANVFTVIIPNQMNIIKSSLKNKKFNNSLSLGLQRSIHNNYSTFLVLFIMLSGHYSFIVYHKYNWLILFLDYKSTSDNYSLGKKIINKNNLNITKSIPIDLKKKKINIISTSKNVSCIKLENNPWIIQPFEVYEEIRIEDIKKKHQK